MKFTFILPFVCFVAFGDSVHVSSLTFDWKPYIIYFSARNENGAKLGSSVILTWTICVIYPLWIPRDLLCKLREVVPNDQPIYIQFLFSCLKGWYKQTWPRMSYQICNCFMVFRIRFDSLFIRYSKEQKTATITVESNAPNWITKLIVIRKGSSKLQLSGRQHRGFF